ncbi:hypothetical protein DN062_13630 [Nitrincola tibetensis]|uniref:Type IV secretion system putative lipoprotein virB7 n=1 Tax=Nitrincola tibetensis TaxID=2219697 RepID=A0A364NJA9_9GAMM|nr:SHOCT domain-containing protein [Nitrincola tibetensis]RAU17208.1 hypothetical protein DN062_13630 [Nitrincola tibetensis]
MKKMLTLAVSAAFLTGCAGSANHKVLTANQAGDSMLNCQQIDAEIVRAQVVIDGVNQDKNDLSGADIIDGLLWFPFNLIAKSGNYSNALKAADERIGRLQQLKTEKSCGGMNKEQQSAAADEILTKLSELSQMHKAGELTTEEYNMAKRKVLDL